MPTQSWVWSFYSIAQYIVMCNRSGVLWATVWRADSIVASPPASTRQDKTTSRPCANYWRYLTTNWLTYIARDLQWRPHAHLVSGKLFHGTPSLWTLQQLRICQVQSIQITPPWNAREMLFECSLKKCSPCVQYLLSYCEGSSSITPQIN